LCRGLLAKSEQAQMALLRRLNELCLSQPAQPFQVSTYAAPLLLTAGAAPPKRMSRRKRLAAVNAGGLDRLSTASLAILLQLLGVLPTPFPLIFGPTGRAIAVQVLKRHKPLAARAFPFFSGRGAVFSAKS
jgi:hypothetical protein